MAVLKSVLKQIRRRKQTRIKGKQIRRRKQIRRKLIRRKLIEKLNEVEEELVGFKV